MLFRALLLLVVVIAIAPTSGFGQSAFSSTLPLIVIDTRGKEIRDEPKITARMGVVDNGPGRENRPTDPFNNYDGWVGIEGRGSTSQSLFPKIGYGLETRDIGGDGIDVSLLGFPKEEDWVLHGPYSDKSMIRNALTYHLAGQFMEYAPRIRMVELIINGDYRGVYLLTERIKRGEDRIDINKLKPDENSGNDLTGGYILKIDKATAEDDRFENAFVSDHRAGNGLQTTISFRYHYPKPEDITRQQKDYIRGYMSRFEGALAGDNFLDPVSGYRSYVDLQSFVDFFIVNELTRNVDGYRLSTYFHKDKDSKDPRLKMGSVWDFNIALGNANYCDGGEITGWAHNFNTVCERDANQIPFWWRRMLQDPVFVQMLKDRWAALRQGTLRDGYIYGTIDSLVVEMEGAVDRNFDRWQILGGEYVWPNAFQGDTYDDEVEYLKDWLRGRLVWLDREMKVLSASPPPVISPKLIVSPNPTTGSSGFSNLDPNIFKLIEVYDFSGRLVQRHPDPASSMRIDLTNFPSGIYTVLATRVNGSTQNTTVVRR